MGTTAPGIGLRKEGTNPTINDFGIVGLPGGSTSTPNVENYVNSQNAGSAPGSFGVGGTALISATSGFSSCSEPAGLNFHDVATASAGTVDDSSEPAGVLSTPLAHNGKGPGGDRTIEGDEPVRWETDFGAAELSHLNLYDRTVEGLVLKDVPGATVQYHPEAGPGPHDARYLFDRFLELAGA